MGAPASDTASNEESAPSTAKGRPGRPLRQTSDAL